MVPIHLLLNVIGGADPRALSLLVERVNPLVSQLCGYCLITLRIKGLPFNVF